MFRHVSVLRWKDRALVDAEDLARRFEALPGKIPGIVRLVAGVDRRLAERNADFVLIVDFPSDVEWRAYTDNPHHLAIAHAIKGHLAERSSVQIELPEGGTA